VVKVPTSAPAAREMTTTTSSSGGSTAAAAKRPLRAWPRPVVESRGDYAADAFLETHIGGPLYALQADLPSLPVPNVEDTLGRFLPTALPLAEADAEAEALAEACRTFPAQAERLQRRLRERRDEARSGGTSWLQRWWNTMGYLQVRDPVVINVSYFFQLDDDFTLPSPPSPMVDRGAGRSLGVMRGAAVLRAVGEYRRRVCSGSLPCEAVGQREPRTPLCSAAFKYMFHACRVPARGQDTYRMYDPSLHRHCVVASKGYFFAVDFVEGDGHPLPLRVLEERLQRCVDMASELQLAGTVPRLGLLTTGDRDSWADSRSRLLDAGGTLMKRAVEKLESGAFLLCLDDNEPLSLKQCGINYWHGGKESGHNRWFDKSMQFVCTKNGKVGFIGEHSMMDGMPALNTKYRDASSNNGGASTSTRSGDSNGVEHIFHDCMPTIEGNNVIQDDINQAGTCLQCRGFTGILRVATTHSKLFSLV
jgi:carnitine O-acetyltransferase